ncbi:MAG: hypothetical protein IIB54_15580 [Planctomycetes bacterium]|nr:hypothetical protein [Planctomycetota bacterium]
MQGVQFNEDVQVEVEGLVVRSDRGGETISPNVMALAYDVNTRTAVWTFPGKSATRSRAVGFHLRCTVSMAPSAFSTHATSLM